jgi:hypothetical protein
LEERLRCNSRSNSAGSNCVPSASVTREIRSKESEGTAFLIPYRSLPQLLKSQLKGARGDKSFAAGTGNLLKVALSIEAQSFGFARPLAQLRAKNQI